MKLLSVDSGLKLMNGFNEGDGNLVSCCQRMDFTHGEMGLGMNAGVFSVGESPGAALTKYPKRGASTRKSILPHPGDHTSEVEVSQGCAPSRGSRGGSFLPLPASGGSRRPWACGRLPPVSASVFPGFLLCVLMWSSVRVYLCPSG